MGLMVKICCVGAAVFGSFETASTLLIPNIFMPAFIDSWVVEYCITCSQSVPWFDIIWLYE